MLCILLRSFWNENICIARLRRDVTIIFFRYVIIWTFFFKQFSHIISIFRDPLHHPGLSTHTGFLFFFFKKNKKPLLGRI